MRIKTSVLVIFPSSCNIIKFSDIVNTVRTRLALRNVSTQRVTYETRCIIFEVNNLVDAMSSVSEIYGIERVAIAKKVNNEFRDLTDNIVRIGRRIVVP